jgi:flavin-binding protein dodecin
MRVTETAFADVRNQSGDADADEVHKAWVVLHDEMTAAAEDASGSTTWITHAAMMLLVGVGSEARSTTAATDDTVGGADPRLDDVDRAWVALVDGRLDEAADLAARALDAPHTRTKADGKVVHFANLVLGHVRLRREDIEGAERHLLAAGDTTGSPTLVSFGPNMALAHALLLRGRIDVVLAYFEKCARFWGSLPKWMAEVETGEIPDFGANLIYGLPKAVQGLV